MSETSDRDNAMAEICRQDLTPSEKLILCKLLYSANKNGQIEIGLTLLSSILVMRREHVSRAVKKLLDRGIITRKNCLQGRSLYTIPVLLNSCQFRNGGVANFAENGCEFRNTTHMTIAATSRPSAGGLPRTNISAAKRDRRPVTK